MAIAIDSSSKLEMIIASDRGKPKEEQTIFYVRPMTVKEMRKLHQKWKGGSVPEADFSFDELLDMITSFLVGWRNFKNAEGKEVPFVPGSKENIERFSIDLLMELWAGIMEVQRLEEVASKNFG